MKINYFVFLSLYIYTCHTLNFKTFIRKSLGIQEALSLLNRIELQLQKIEQIQAKLINVKNVYEGKLDKSSAAFREMDAKLRKF